MKCGVKVRSDWRHRFFGQLLTSRLTVISWPRVSSEVFLRASLSSLALVCFGLLWFALVCFGLLWFALVCFGLSKTNIQKRFRNALLKPVRSKAPTTIIRTKSSSSNALFATPRSVAEKHALFARLLELEAAQSRGFGRSPKHSSTREDAGEASMAMQNRAEQSRAEQRSTQRLIKTAWTASCGSN